MKRRAIFAAVIVALVTAIALPEPSAYMPTEQTLCTTWTYELGPPKVTVTVSTPCGGPVSRQCQTEHNRSVAVSQAVYPPVPGEPIVETVK